MVGAKQQDPHGGQSYQGSGSFAFRKQAGRGMTRIEKIIVVVLCLLSLSFLGYMIAPWTSQGTPAAAAPGAPTAAPDHA